jgi:hypothetical protein
MGVTTVGASRAHVAETNRTQLFNGCRIFCDGNSKLGHLTQILKRR